MLQQIHRSMKNSFTFFIYRIWGGLKGAYLCDCSLYTLEILMHAPKPYFTKATFSHRGDSTIYFLVTLIYYKGISNMQKNMPSHNLKVLVVVPLKTHDRKTIPFFNHETTQHRNIGRTLLLVGRGWFSRLWLKILNVTKRCSVKVKKPLYRIIWLFMLVICLVTWCLKNNVVVKDFIFDDVLFLFNPWEKV